MCQRAHEVGGATTLRAFHSAQGGAADGIPRMVAHHLGCVGLPRPQILTRVEEKLRAEHVTDPYEWNAMTELLTLAYPWLRAAHIILVIFWMAGLFLLPRFFVYHQEAAEGSSEASAWVEREDKLATIIMNPSMLIVWVLGLYKA